jgi:hypothetical protein
MASHDAHLGVLPGEDSKPNPWLPQAANHDVVIRFADVLATMCNTGGVAVTHLLRFLILFPAMFLLLLAELLVRFDRQIEKNYSKMGVSRG